jgi:hypothetical protein
MKCELCEREVDHFASHHLIPKSRNKKSKELTILCNACHKMVHRIFTNKELESEYYDLPRIKNHPDLRKFLAWVQKQDPNKKIKIR